jgi:hypothetical protein
VARCQGLGADEPDEPDSEPDARLRARDRARARSGANGRRASAMEGTRGADDNAIGTAEGELEELEEEFRECGKHWISRNWRGEEGPRRLCEWCVVSSSKIHLLSTYHSPRVTCCRVPALL